MGPHGGSHGARMYKDCVLFGAFWGQSWSRDSFTRVKLDKFNRNLLKLAPWTISKAMSLLTQSSEVHHAIQNHTMCAH